MKSLCASSAGPCGTPACNKLSYHTLHSNNSIIILLVGRRRRGSGGSSRRRWRRIAGRRTSWPRRGRRARPRWRQRERRLARRSGGTLRRPGRRWRSCRRRARPARTLRGRRPRRPRRPRQRAGRRWLRARHSSGRRRCASELARRIYGKTRRAYRRTSGYRHGGNLHVS